MFRLYGETHQQLRLETWELHLQLREICRPAGSAFSALGLGGYLQLFMECMSFMGQSDNHGIYWYFMYFSKEALLALFVEVGPEICPVWWVKPPFLMGKSQFSQRYITMSTNYYPRFSPLSTSWVTTSNNYYPLATSTQLLPPISLWLPHSHRYHLSSAQRQKSAVGDSKSGA